MLAADQLLVSGISDLAVREDIPDGAVADAEMNATMSVEVESGGDDEGEEQKGELMIGSDDEGEELKGGIKSKYEAEVLPPVPKIEIQLEPHHQTLPVATISAIMCERVTVKGSVQHNPLNEGSILWITESRMPLGIVEELFGPVKNPYCLVRYNSEEDVPAGISAGTNVSFVAEFADHILNMKELYAKGYDESDSIDNVENDVEPDFSDDEKEAEYKRSLRQAKRQNDRQHAPMKTSCYMKRSQPRGSGIRKPMLPRNLDTSTPVHQPKPHLRRSDMAHAGAENTARPLGPQNASMIAPTMMSRGPMNPAVPTPVPFANQMGACSMNPAQQFLPQQPNMFWPGGFPQPPHPNMGVDGATLAANIVQNLLAEANQFQQQFQNQNFSGTGANPFQQQFKNHNFSGPGANQFQQQFQNQNFGGFPNQIRMPFPQFMQQTGMPANPMPFGGRPPVNSPFGPAPQVPMGQGSFGRLPNPQGFTDLGPPPRGDGQQDSPPQFSCRQFHQGRSSFGQGRTQQRGGRHSSGRGGPYRR